MFQNFLANFTTVFDGEGGFIYKAWKLLNRVNGATSFIYKIARSLSSKNYAVAASPLLESKMASHCSLMTGTNQVFVVQNDNRPHPSRWAQGGDDKLVVDDKGRGDSRGT